MGVTEQAGQGGSIKTKGQKYQPGFGGQKKRPRRPVGHGQHTSEGSRVVRDRAQNQSPKHGQALRRA